MTTARNPNIKKAHEETEYTPEQVVELKKCSKDPIYFADNYIQVQHPKKGAIPIKLRLYQKKIIQAIHDNRDIIVMAPRQAGKALDIDTEIATPNGWKIMKDLQIGDYVFGADGKPTKIINTSEVMYDHVCYEVKFSTGDTIIADAGHLWEVERAGHKKLILKTEEIVNDRINGYKNAAGRSGFMYSVKTAMSLDLPEKELPIHPYVLGVWLGDGTSRSGEITSHIDDSTEIEIKLREHGYNLYVRRRPNTNVNTITIYGIKPLLRKMNLIQNKHIPIEYLRSSYNQRLDLLKGLMDTDGFADKRVSHPCCEISLSNEILARDVRELICSLGLKPTTKVRKTKAKDSYRMTFPAFRDKIEVFYLKRKLEKMNQTPNEKRKQSSLKREIISITAVESRPVRCITVDNKDHLYLAGRGMIPTHNSIAVLSYILWYSIFHFDKFILIASSKNKNAVEMIRRLRYAYEYLPHWIKPGVEDDGWNQHSIKFDNNSIIESTSTTEDSGRSFSISFLYLDEFAYVKPNIQDEFWTSIEPTLSEGEKCVITSTPNNDDDIFATIWNGAELGVNGFVAVRVEWNEPPGRDEDFRKKKIDKIGQHRWDREYELKFVSADDLLIDALILNNLAAEVRNIVPIEILKGIKFYKALEKDKTYIIGVDPSTGVDRDFSVIEVFEYPSMHQVAEYRDNNTSSSDLYTLLKNLLLYLEKRCKEVLFSVENNGVGEAMNALYEADETPPLHADFISEAGANRAGFTTSPRSKKKFSVILKELVEKRKMKINSHIVVAEFKAYVRKHGSFAARSGATDDCVSAIIIVLRIVDSMFLFDDQATEALYGNYTFDQWDDERYNPESDDLLPIVF